MEVFPTEASTMGFSERLSTLRKERGFTQQALAEKVGVNLSQIHRYESGAALPTFDVLKGLAQALRVTGDVLLFDKDERGADEELRLQFEAIKIFSKEEKRVVRALLEGLILKHEAQKWAESSR